MKRPIHHEENGSDSQRKCCRRITATSLMPALLLSFSAVQAQNKVYDLHLEPSKFTLYTDPYNGNRIQVGGFSGMYPLQKDLVYVITDRGPAPDYTDANGKNYKTFAIPEFGPHLITLRLSPSGKTFVQKIQPLRRPDGTPISGLPTTVPATDVPYDFYLKQLPYDEDSIDAEGITKDPWGNYWVCDEYKPSVAMLSADGTVHLRLVPAGTVTGHEQVPTYPVLPGVLAKRRNNRGFEGIAASSDGILYAAVQRPLNNPNRSAADANGNARLVAINLHTLLHKGNAPLIRQYLYQMPPASGSVTVSDLFSTGPTTLLIPERGTDKLFEINVVGATDITPLEDEAGKLISDPTKTFEQLTPAGMGNLGVVAVSKTVIIDSLTAIDPLLEKVEGVCVVDGRILLTYDNDFNIAETASTPFAVIPNGPLVELDLLGANYPRVFSIPIPK